MEPGEWMVWGITWAVLYVGLSYIVNKSRKSRRLPPGPKGWPLLGSLPSLGAMPHASLYNLSRKYGPIMYLKLGTSGMVVASAPETAKAFLKTLGANFSNRPRNASATYLTYEANDMVFAPYGPRWNMLRKVCNLHLLGGKALGGWQPVREAETSHMLRSILHHSNRSQPVNLPELLSYTMANLLGQITLSKRVFESQGAEANEFKDMVVQVLISTGLFNIGDVIPSIAWMDLQGIQRNMKKLHRRFDALLTRMIAEHQSSSHQRGRQDFLDVMISHRDNADGEGGKLTDVHIKSLLMDLFTAGTDTSSSTMEWAMAEMLNNPEIAKRAQEEMDAVVGKQRKLRESDIPKLPYLAAICKETFRKHPSTPASNRVSTEACEVGGYYIPKNTRLMVNLWAIGRNPEVWENPLEFNPDRFLGANSKIEPRGNDFELIPFGAGRRICPGNGMAIQVVPYILGSLIHSFDWHLPPDVPHVNMDETYALALQKAVPLVALATPRLPLHLY